MTKMKYLDALLRYFNDNNYTHREDIPVIISDIFEETRDISLDGFTKKIKRIKRDFFRINRLNRAVFSENLYVLLNRIREERPEKADRFTVAKTFISEHFEIGFDSASHVEEREAILKKFSTITKPHALVMEAFNRLLDRISVSYQINLHGVKEYSGIDISKSIENTTIGFQVKSRNDDISDRTLRYETSKAQDWKLNGFVLVYARERSKKVESSIQAGYHHFRSLIDSVKMYCAIIYPELLAELLRKFQIGLEAV